jgi:phosphoribosyl-ATP pyrophosphohydrolase/phosphoribosyl-AMP cyclohydrolase
VESLKLTEDGLIPAIAQDRLSGEIRMVAWMNQEALSRTLSAGRATFFSRSRQTIWEKGETSGNTLVVHSVYLDCDRDVLLLLVDAQGPSCHTGKPTCFFKSRKGDEWVETEIPAGGFIGVLEHELRLRAESSAEKSYTKSLLDGGPAKLGDKLREEADELGRAVAEESDARVASEAADLMYHLLVALRYRGIAWRDVIEVLALRSGTSGLAEKAARQQS